MKTNTNAEVATAQAGNLIQSACREFNVPMDKFLAYAAKWQAENMLQRPDEWREAADEIRATESGDIFDVHAYAESVAKGLWQIWSDLQDQFPPDKQPAGLERVFLLLDLLTDRADKVRDMIGKLTEREQD